MPDIRAKLGTFAVPDLTEVIRRQRRPQGVISTARIDKGLGRGVAGASIILGALAVPAAFTGQPLMHQGWAWVVGLSLFGSISWFAVASARGRQARVAGGAFAVSFLVIMATWSWAILDPQQMLGRNPWPEHLAHVALAAAAYAFPRRYAIAYLAAVYWVWVIVRQTPAAGGAPAIQAFGEAGYGILIGASALILIHVLRRSAAAVDSAHNAAAAHYALAVKEHQTEIERLQVDSILHDSVMTTLLVAAKSQTHTDQAHSVAMAKHALTEIAATGTSPYLVKDAVDLEELLGRFRKTCGELGITAAVTSSGLEDAAVPGSIVDTFFGAVMQALNNSVQHAGPGNIRRTVHISWSNSTLEVHVSDNGAGFDTSTMTPHRMGIRVSIIERMHQIGGQAVIRSAPGRGTQIHLTWSATPATDKSTASVLATPN